MNVVLVPLAPPMPGRRGWLKRRATLSRALGAALLWMGLACTGAAQTSRSPALAHDLREQIFHTPVTLTDAYDRTETASMPITLFRPPGPGPFPLVLLNHGRAVSAKRARQGRARFEPVARYLVSRGYAVAVPTRIGYWETYGSFDPEDTGPCGSPRLAPQSRAASDQVLATVEFARTLADIDADHWVVMGVSVGGLTTVATVARQPKGLIAGLNFSGGTGGDPDMHTGSPCSPSALERLWRGMGATSRAPMLWLYWENDRYWGPDIPKRWFDAWTEGGGHGEFHSFPAHGNDGHAGMNEDMEAWKPVVEGFLRAQGLP